MKRRLPVFTSAVLLGLLAVGPAALGAGAEAPGSSDGSGGSGVPAVVQGIRTEAMRPNDDPAGYPLPLAANWNSNHWGPGYQVQMIERGHHILPWMKEPRGHPDMSAADIDKYKNSETGKAVRAFARWGLPLTLSDGNYTSPLNQKKYRELPPARTPLTVKPDGSIWKRPSPFGAIQPWREVGEARTHDARLKALEQLYPDPPRVLFLSNNEARKLRWHEADKSKRFLAKYGKNASGVQKREAFAKGWKPRFDAMFDGMRRGLSSDAWRKNAVFMAYKTTGPHFYGRWGGWKHYALPTPGQINPEAAWWGGGTASIYDNDWEHQKSDYNVWSPQIGAMNLPLLREASLKLNPDFWFEVSVWDGNKDWWTASPNGRKYRPKKKAKPDQYRAKGQTWSPARYGGWTQYVMWVSRPRVMRGFRGWSQPRKPVTKDGKQLFTGFQPYWDVLVGNVDRVWNNDVLTRFWRKGKLVPTGKSPWDHNLLKKYQGVPRWFRLDTSLDPPRPWKNTTNLHVYCLAYVLGQGDSREWLVYAHSPLGEKKGVQVMVPGHGKITIDIPVGGAFYHITQSGGVQRVAENAEAKNPS